MGLTLRALVQGEDEGRSSPRVLLAAGESSRGRHDLVVPVVRVARPAPDDDRDDTQMRPSVRVARPAPDDDRDDTQMKPSVGRIAHYVSYGSKGGEYSSECRSAVITEVGGATDADAQVQPVVGLCVLNPTGIFFRPVAEGGCRYDEGTLDPLIPSAPARRRYAPGSWHWPERVE